MTYYCAIMSAHHIKRTNNDYNYIFFEVLHMSSKIKKSKTKQATKLLPLMLGALFMMIFGAATTYAVSKVLTPTQPVISTPAQPIIIDKQANSAPAVVAPVIPVQPVEKEPVSPVLSPVPTHVMAQIIAVKPQYTTKLVSYRSCKMVPRPVMVHNQRAIDGSGVVLGGVTGGILGNQIGRGNGNIVATVGGAIVGSLVGNNVEREMNRPNMQYVYVKVCQTHQREKSVLTGYNVTYEYDGKQATKFMKTKPQSDQLRLELAPAVS